MTNERPPTEETSLLPPSPPPPRHSLLTQTLSLITIATVCLGQFLVQTPLTQALTDAICQQSSSPSSPSSSSPLAQCDRPEIHAAVGDLLAWSASLELLPGLLTSVAYGVLAEKAGRRFVIRLSVLGIVAGLWWNVLMVVAAGRGWVVVEWFLGGNVFLFVGGGGTTLVAMVLTSVTEVTKAEQRSTIFLIQSGLMRAALIVANPISYILMSLGTTTALLTGALILTLGCLIATTIPETTTPPPSVPLFKPARLHLHIRSLATHAAKTTATLRSSLTHVITHHPKVVLLLFADLLTMSNNTAQATLFTQYVSARFHWSLAVASLVVSVEAFATLCILVVVIPALSYLLTTKYALEPLRKDLTLARITILSTSLGTLLIGTAPSISTLFLGTTFTALGAAYHSLSRSAMTGLISATAGGDLPVLFTLAATLDTLGSMVAGPAMAGLFRVGLGWGGQWVGLPFVGAGVLCTGAAGVVWRIRAEREESDMCETEEEEEEEEEEATTE